MPSTPGEPVRSRIRRGAGLVAAVALVAAGCADDDSTVEAAEPEPVEVVAVDFEFRDLPESVPAGTRLTIVNEAATELHEIVALRIPDEEERSADELVQLPPDELEAAMGPIAPATVLLAAPGGDQITAVGDGTLDEPGRYLLVCMIPTGVDPDAYLAAAAEAGDEPPQIDGGGAPHIAHGMYAELIVEG